MAIPAQVVESEPNFALVAYLDCPGRPPVRVRCGHVPDLAPGDWVMVFAGQVVMQISAEESSTIQSLLQEMRA